MRKESLTDAKALPPETLRGLKALYIVLLAIMIFACWAAYLLVLNGVAKPFLDYAGVLAALVMLAGAVALIWVATGITRLAVRAVTAYACPECGGRVKFRRTRAVDDATYLILKCTRCAQDFENFGWHSRFLGYR